MARLHEDGIGKTQRIIGYALSILVSLGIFGSGVTKFFSGTEIHALLERLNMADHAVMIGLVEILVVVLYWIPKISNIGFFVFCSYAGGIVVGELILGDIPIPGLVTGAMVYVGTLLRKPSLLG